MRRPKNPTTVIRTPSHSGGGAARRADRRGLLNSALNEGARSLNRPHERGGESGRTTMARRSQAAFFKGVSRVFDLSGVLSRGNRSSFAADGWAIRSDWSVVGRDLSEANHRVRTQASDGSFRDRTDDNLVGKPKQLRLLR